MLARETSGAGFTALPRTACFKLCATAYRVFSAELYRVPRLFNAALPLTASFQLDTTAYRVVSEGNYRIPRLFWDPPIEFRIHLCTGKLQHGLSVLLPYFSIIENADATPPHLEVTLRLVSSAGMQGSLQVFAFGLFSCFL